MAKNIDLVLFGTTIVLSGCQNPYAGMSLEEVISKVSTPEEAQEFIDWNISYCSEDEKALNKADTQAAEYTFNRGCTSCRGGAVLSAALLKDDNYPSLFLAVDWVGDSGHMVFIYQKSSGWGTTGINEDDYRDAETNSLQELAAEIAVQFKEAIAGYTVINMSPIELVKGAYGGLLKVYPFAVERNFPDYWTRGTVGSHTKGYAVMTENSTPETGYWKEDTVYTPDLFEENQAQSWTSTENGNDYVREWLVIERSDLRLPSKTVQLTSENGKLRWFTETLFEYYPDGTVHVEEQRISYDGDLETDRIIRTEYSEGHKTTYYDYDADGVWDEIIEE